MTENTLNPVVIAGIVGMIGIGVGFGAAQLPQLKGTRAPTLAPNSSIQPGNGNRFRGGAAGNRANRGVMGQITGKDDKSLTVKLPDGSSKIVIISDKTTYQMMTSAKKDDVAQGKSVRVMGITNQDGSVTADSVFINPQQFQRSDQAPTSTPAASPAVTK